MNRTHFKLPQIILAAALLLNACAHQQPSSLDSIATAYVKLVLALGEHDPDTVDAYYGPPEWREEVKQEKKSLAEVREEIGFLRAALAASSGGDRARRIWLDAQLGALATRAAIVAGERMSFDEEARALFGVTPPHHDAAQFEQLLQSLERELPGDGPLAERYDRYAARFRIPAEKLDTVVRAAMDECRRRALSHIAAPPNDAFVLEYVQGKPWAGYNWYQGNYRSLIQVNTDIPVEIEKPLSLACHEGYPGHHLFNSRLEKDLVRDRGWVEYMVYPLFSPQSLLAEGTGNYGVDMAFPPAERLAFDRDVLFPLAGLDPADAERYYQVRELRKGLSYATNYVARTYLDGEISKEEATAALMRYGLYSPARAEQSMRFIEQYRSYVINYNFGEDLVKGWVEQVSGEEARWKRFEYLLTNPVTPKELLPGE